MIPFRTLSSLARTLENQPDSACLRIIHNGRGYHFTATPMAIDEAATHPIFFELIGSANLQRVFQIEELKLDADQLLLTKKNVSKIIVGLLHLKLCEYPSHFSELKPLFLGRAPELDHLLYDIASTAGKGARGLTERVYIAAHHYFRLKEEPAKNHPLIDAEFLTSRLADREMTEHTIIHLAEGDYRVDALFTEGGSYTAVLKKVTGRAPLKIVCRGTSTRPQSTGSFKSCLNNIQLKIGTMGVTTIWPELSQYLRSNDCSAVELYGKSLGGAHAQLLAILIEGVERIPIDHLTTVCSVGVGDTIARLFEEHVLRHRERQFPIHVIRNGGNRLGFDADLIPLVGGVHLGDHDRCDVRVTYLNEDSHVTPIPQDLSLIQKIILFVQSFGKAHNRQSTLAPFSVITLTDQAARSHLRFGAELETLRYCFACFAHMASFTLLNPENFSQYVHKKKGTSSEVPLALNETEPLLI